MERWHAKVVAVIHTRTCPTALHYLTSPYQFFQVITVFLHAAGGSDSPYCPRRALSQICERKVTAAGDVQQEGNREHCQYKKKCFFDRYATTLSHNYALT